MPHTEGAERERKGYRCDLQQMKRWRLQTTRCKHPPCATSVSASMKQAHQQVASSPADDRGSPAWNRPHARKLDANASARGFAQQSQRPFAWLTCDALLWNRLRQTRFLSACALVPSQHASGINVDMG
eukprot:1806055-Rhodomonas_salina.1